MTHYVIVRSGTGTQLASVLGGHPFEARVYLTKWRAKSKRWTQPRWFPAEVVIGEAPKNDPRRRHADKVQP